MKPRSPACYSRRLAVELCSAWECPGPTKCLFPPFPQAPPAAALLEQSRTYTVQLHKGQSSPLHRFGFDRCGHSCPAFPEAKFAKRIQTVTLTALLAVAAGDEPTAIAKFMAENLSAEEPEHVCCIVQSITDSFVRQKGLVGHLDLGREDEIAALWYTLARSLAIERHPHSRVVDFVRALQSSNRAWDMPAAHRIPSECHPDCRAWYEARHARVSLFDFAQHPGHVATRPLLLQGCRACRNNHQLINQVGILERNASYATWLAAAPPKKGRYSLQAVSRGT